jgi:hypothetical protein
VHGPGEAGGSGLSSEDEVFTHGTRRPSFIWIGSTSYLYEGSGRARSRHSWIRFHGVGSAEAIPSLPFRGGGSMEVNAGGSGSYAGLINLLATTTGPVSVAGPVNVDGQQTTEFTAAVDQFRLIKGISATELAAIRAHPSATQTLEVFITEAGVPIRVVSITGVGATAIPQTTDILAINAPVTIKPPPARETISASRLSRKGSSSSFALFESSLR